METEIKLELLQVMHSPPILEEHALGRWIAKLQSLAAEIRRVEKRAKRGK